MPRHQRQPSAEQPPNRSSELQRRRVAQSTEQPPRRESSRAGGAPRGLRAEILARGMDRRGRGKSVRRRRRR